MRLTNHAPRPVTPRNRPETAHGTERQGLIFGGAAVLSWSFASLLIFLGAREAGMWSFVAVASLIGGMVQLVAWRWHRGRFRSALRLPWRLWAVSVPCFVAYGLVWPAAVVTSSPQEVYGVNLINYLWPVLTVLLAAWWVPGAQLTARTILAAGLSLAGLVCANLSYLRAGFATASGQQEMPAHGLLPYGLALGAAVSWAVYSASLARWRHWAGAYATSPLGFLLTGLIAAAVNGFSGDTPAPASQRGMLLTVAYGIGPLAVGYLSWEVALARARVQSLGLLGALTPVLSTLLLCVFLRSVPGPELIVGAVLVSAGALLSVRT